MDRNSVIALFLLYCRRKRRGNGLHWLHPIIKKKKRKEFGAFYTLFGELRDEANKFFKLFSNVRFIFRRDCDSTIFKRSTLWTSIQTNMLELPSERPLTGTEDPNVPHFFAGDEGFALNRNLL